MDIDALASAQPECDQQELNDYVKDLESWFYSEEAEVS